MKIRNTFHKRKTLSKPHWSTVAEGVVLARMSKFMYKVKVAFNAILIRHVDQMLSGSRFPMPEYDNFRATNDINDDLNLCSDNVN